MKEQVILEIISKCITFLSTEQCQQLRLVLGAELHKYKLEQECTDITLSSNYQSKLLLYIAFKQVEGLSPRTLKEYKQVLTNFILEVNKDFDKVEEMDIRLYMARCMQRGLKNSTINTNVNHIKSFYGWMYDNEYVKKNPAKLIKNVKFDKYIRKALNDEEFEKLKYACKTDREKALVSIFYSTGARVSEICALNKNDIDWYNNTIKVFGKGKKQRWVYMNGNSKLYLSKYLESRNDNQDALFVASKKPHNRLSCRSIEKEFSVLGERAGISNRVFPHLLRHTMATNYIRKSSNIAEVSKILGHSNISTTQIYAQVSNDSVKHSFEKFMN